MDKVDVSNVGMEDFGFSSKEIQELSSTFLNKWISPDVLQQLQSSVRTGRYSLGKWSLVQSRSLLLCKELTDVFLRACRLAVPEATVHHILSAAIETGFPLKIVHPESSLASFADPFISLGRA